MNREIKFRVWSKNKKDWLNSICFGCDGIPFVHFVEIDENQKINHKVFNLDGFEPIIQQCTGLKDINQKEIYEGDIVKIINFTKNNQIENRLVIWDNISFKWGLRYKDWGTFTQSLPAFKNDIEIVGNIFENSDLI